MTVLPALGRPTKGKGEKASSTGYRGSDDLIKALLEWWSRIGQALGNQRWGALVRDTIADQYPGSWTEVRVPTSGGTDAIDVLTPEGTAIESKIGYLTNESAVRAAVTQDQELVGQTVTVENPDGTVANVTIRQVQWIFTPMDTALMARARNWLRHSRTRVLIGA